LNTIGGGSEISFATKCTIIPHCQADRLIETAELEEGNGNLIYLERADISSGAQEVLRKCEYVRVAGGKYKIAYACCKPYPPLAGCAKHNIVKNADGGGQLIYIDRHAVKCPVGSAMNRWNFQMIGSSESQINYRCCESIEVPTEGPVPWAR